MADFRAELLEALPEIGWIEDAALREKVVAAHMKALGLSGRTVASLGRMPFTLLIDPCPASYIEHVRAVTRVAASAADAMQEIYGAKLKLQRDIVLAAAMLHDIGKLLEIGEGADGRPQKTRSGQLLRHPFSGLGLLFDLGLPEEVLHAVAVHAREGEGGYRTPEASLVHFADFMNFEPFRAK